MSLIDSEKRDLPFEVTSEHLLEHTNILTIGRSGSFPFDILMQSVIKEVESKIDIPISQIEGDFTKIPTRPFLRDIILLGQQDGIPGILVNYPYIYESIYLNYTTTSNRQIPNAVKFDFSEPVKLIANSLGLPIYLATLFIEGGNLIRTRDFILLGRDIVFQEDIHRKKFPNPNIYKGKALSRINSIFNLSSQVPVVVDFPKPLSETNYDYENLQIIPHIDMCLNVVLGEDGKEYFLLGDIDLADELLQGKSIYSDGVDNLTCRDFISDIENKRPKMLSVKNKMKVTRYLKTIERNLLQSGVQEDQIIKIPILTIAQDQKSKFNRITGKTNRDRINDEVITVSPLNGIQINKNGVRSFIRPAGLSSFDSYVKERLTALGIKDIPIYSAFEFGKNNAGIRCLMIPT